MIALFGHSRTNDWNGSVCAVLFLIGIVIALGALIHKGNNSNDSESGSKNSTSSSTTNDSGGSASSSSGSPGSSSSSCVRRRPEPHLRTVVFWQTEVDGCEKIPSGVTHVVFGFALVDGANDRVVPVFQNTDEEIQMCVKTLRSKCIASLGSIGGSTNNEAIANVTDVRAFAASAVELVQKFNFDGVDIDDETVGSDYNATRLVSSVQATRAALDEVDKTLLLTYDAYFNEGEPSFCKNEAFASYTRCFPTEILAFVDWVNIMAYNVAQNEVIAADIYEKALTTTFVDWKAQLGGDFSQAAIGVCVKKSCAYGPGPSEEVIASWNKLARAIGTGGGMMVYAASGEVTEDFFVTRSVLP